jgi:hypothetical protein
MRIDSSGNIAIGGTSASNFSGYVTLDLRDTTGGLIDFSEASAGVHSRIQAVVNNSLNILNRQNYPLHLGTNDTTRLTITGAGNVGIGTTQPAEKLQVGLGEGDFISAVNTSSSVGSSNFWGFALHEGTTTIGEFSCVRDGTANQLYIGGSSANQTLRFGVGAKSEAMRINSDGRLLVGRTSVIQSDNRIAVSGSGTGAGNAIQDIRNTSTSDTCGCLSLSKSSTTTTSAARYIWFFANNFGSNMGAIGGAGLNNVQFIASSDERLKENITPITGSLDKVLALNPVSFDWKQNGEHREAGFVAQEVEKVYPEYVVTDDDEMKTKNIGGGMTAGYVAELTKAIQEQQEQIETLKAEVKELKEG